MIARLVLTGHRRLLAAHLLALSLLGAVLGGMLGTLMRARDAAAALCSAPLMTTHLLSRISQLGGLINFMTMVVVIAGVVALMLSGTIASFTVEGFAAASRSLRLLGASRHYEIGRATCALPIWGSDQLHDHGRRHRRRRRPHAQRDDRLLHRGGLRRLRDRKSVV